MGLISPDSFTKDPGRYIENQGGHMALGAVGAVLICAGYLAVIGQFPHRHIVFAIMALFYLVKVELIGQGWQGWDTLEDTIFVVAYGAGPILYGFHEVSFGSGAFSGNIWDVVPFMLCAFVHLAIGAAYRAYKKARADA